MQNKREFDKRARENNYDLLYKNECQNWRNKINKAKKTEESPSERLEKMEETFEVFKKGESDANEFMDWVYQQSSIIAELAEK